MLSAPSLPGRVSLALAVALFLALAAVPAGLAQGTETAVRVVAIDGETGELTVVDPETEQVVGRFGTAAGGWTPIASSGGGRYVLVNHNEASAVTLLDGGLRLEDHGDHVDLVVGAPFVRATVEVGRAPAHYWTHDGVIAVYSDGDGTVTLFDESELDERIEPVTFSVGPADHASIALLDDALLVAPYGGGRVDVYDLEGGLIEEGIATCPGAHGEGRAGGTVAFACDDGLLLISAGEDGFRTERLAYPGGAVATPEATPATPETAATPAATPVVERSNLIAWHEETSVLVGDFPDGLLLIDPAAGTVDRIELPATPLWMTFDTEGERVAVLTDDGALHAIDPLRGEVLWSTPTRTPYSIEEDQATGYRSYPFVAAGPDAVYVPDPEAGEIVEVALDSGDVTKRITLDGEPARVALVVATGAVH